MINLTCLLTGGLVGILSVTLVYYFFTEWNAE